MFGRGISHISIRPLSTSSNELRFHEPPDEVCISNNGLPHEAEMRLCSSPMERSLLSSLRHSLFSWPCMYSRIGHWTVGIHGGGVRRYCCGLDN